MLQQDVDFGHSNVMHKCGPIGHIKAVCRSSPQYGKASNQNRPRREVKKLEEVSEENEYLKKLEEALEKNEYTLFNLCQSSQCSSPLLQPWKWPTRSCSRLHADFGAFVSHHN